MLLKERLAALESKVQQQSDPTTEETAVPSQDRRNSPGQVEQNTADDGSLHRYLDAVPFSHDSNACIQFVTAEAQQYLLDLYWEHFHTIFPIVNRELFLQAKQSQNPKYFSRCLYLCLLAVGSRFADTTRPEIRALFGESQRDIEATLGRNTKGWMYIGMACRLAIQLKLDLDSATSDCMPCDLEVRQYVLYTCVIYDRYWDIIISHCGRIESADFKLLQCAANLMIPVRSTVFGIAHGEVSKMCQELISPAGKMTEKVGQTREQLTQNDYLGVTALGRDLELWYQSLPEEVSWTPANVQAATSSWFLFHQHYYVSIILLHRPFARLRRLSLLDDQTCEEAHTDQVCRLSRSICFEHAIGLVKVFSHHHDRFGGSRMLFPAVGHADVAAVTLLACLQCTDDAQTRVRVRSYLGILSDIIRSLGRPYVAAERMSHALDTALKKWHNTSSSSNSIPIKPSNHHDDMAMGISSPTKRQRLSLSEGDYTAMFDRSGFQQSNYSIPFATENTDGRSESARVPSGPWNALEDYDPLFRTLDSPQLTSHPDGEAAWMMPSPTMLSLSENWLDRLL
ncbi:hypothetical protein BDV18DRAFT_159652 [Aspergillus unguis]